jgi:hypothetical protein
VFERDYLMREVKKLMELLARIAQLRNEAKLDVALTEVGAAYDRLGISKSMLEYVDVASLSRMLGSPEMVAAIGKLMAEEAAVLEAKGDPLAESKRQRAETLLAHR